MTEAAREAPKTAYEVLAVLLQESRDRTGRSGRTEVESLALDGKTTTATALRANWTLQSVPDNILQRL